MRARGANLKTRLEKEKGALAIGCGSCHAGRRSSIASVYLVKKVAVINRDHATANYAFEKYLVCVF